MARGVIGFLEGATLAWIEAGAPDIEAVGRPAVDDAVARPVHGSGALSDADSSARQQYQAATLR